MICNGTDIIITEINCTINVMLWIILKPFLPPQSGKLSSVKWVLVPKMLGTDMFDHIKWSKIQVIWVLKGVERENEVEYIVGKKISNNFPQI